ncbi:MAG: hypothetical protein A2Z34_12125 [Planctomycetes bacterium RBG_16_59_8]|nr:MAG: hypothetical protein A2Z34_12125 [Planctomycetes bacterium RBG_16_59_8]
MLRERSEIFNIGIGLGISNGIVGARFPDVHSMNVDYSPAVLSFIRRYADFNGRLLEQKNSEVRIADGRLALLRDERVYDLIAELGNQDGYPGASTIKSVEFLELVRRRLRPGGVYFAAGTGRFFAATLQSTFRNVYAVRGLLTFIATDSDLPSLVDITAIDRLRAVDADFAAEMDRIGGFQIVRLAPIGGRLVRDEDPVADYNRRHVNAPDEGEVALTVGRPRH